MGGRAVAVELSPIPAPASDRALAWIRFSDGPESYAGRPYEWLGRGPLKVRFETPAQAATALELFWGAKNDLRHARLAINGHTREIAAGGYDGFRWIRVPLPAGLRGDRLELTLTASEGKAAFLAEMRVIAAAATGSAPETGAPVHRAEVLVRPTRPAGRTPGPMAEAFPDMRPVWDAPPPAPAGGRLPAGLEAVFQQAETNARLAAEALYRCRRYVDGWLAHADPRTGLIPRNLTRDRDLWNGRDAGADNYPFMVLTCALTDRELFAGRMLAMLRTEERLTRRLDRLGDHYSFSRQGFVHPEIDLDRLVFDNAEYVKDGLIPLTEWLGPSPWSKRMIGLVEDIWKHAAIETPFGPIPTLNFEVNGDLMQAGARLFWFTGRREFLDQAMRLADFYLLGDQHPTRHRERLSLIDHGCEVINGLSEVYLAAGRVAPEKRDAWREPLHAIYREILRLGRDEWGMLHGWIEPRSGRVGGRISDTWGYVYDGFYTVYLVDGTPEYREAVRHVLANLKDHYSGFRWQGGSADGYADSIEGALNLLQREPIPSAAAWIDAEIRTMWRIQKPDGVIEGWHGDGNFARTSLMYALWKTAGVWIEPWRPDVRFGAAVAADGTLCLSLWADQPWRGRVHFDRPRHRDYLHLPVDYPRINQFPEWFTVEAARRYRLEPSGTTAEPAAGREVAGRALHDGIEIDLPARTLQRWRLRPAAAGG
ncbi:MAG: hypothetical protein D6766_03755 [Verrucomicrobia bacterium]|nr:MAG: hypothetical protein D6766_03755 [Verrucomicrobiota bacterium]